MCHMLAAGAIALIVAGGGANAQSYPTRPMTMVVTFPAGGPVDGVARTLANEMGERLGLRVTIENKVRALG